MKYCMHCGQVMLDSSTVCGRCGCSTKPSAEPQQPFQPFVPQPDPAADQAVLDQVRIGLRHEHKAWKICSVAITILTAILILCMIVIGAESSNEFLQDFSPEYTYSLQLLLVMYSIYVVFAFVPCIVVGFIMTAKCRRHLNNFHADPAAAVQHCGSVGSIVLAALFNGIVLIFVIINFVRCKSNKEALERAVAQKKSAELPPYEM